MTEFSKTFMSDVPRGDTRYLRQQTIPQARWMKIEDIQGSSALAYDPENPGKKVLIGAVGSKLIGIEDDRHLLTVAGSRSGKSVGLVSNLLFYSGSVLATDPKGELADLTAIRRAKLGQRILVLDPFGKVSNKVSKFRASYNPMSALSLDSPSCAEDAALIAESIVVQAADQKDPHWDESAKNFIEGVILQVATAPQHKERRNLITVRELIKKAFWSPPEDKTEEGQKKPKRPKKPLLYEEMMENADALELEPETETETENIGSSILAAALDFYSKSEGEMSTVHSTVNRHTKFLDYPAFRSVLVKNDFDLSELKSHAGGVSIYLCFPATRSEMSKRWMRIFVNQLLDAMEREKTVPAVPVLACLDEFPVLGYMKQLETASGLIASFGVKLWIILQDWSQGKALYGDRWETFAGNAGIVQFFGNTDLTTTQYISTRLGKTPVEVSNTGEVAQEQQAKGLSGRSESIQLYDLLTPDEISRLFAREDRLQRQLILEIVPNVLTPARAKLADAFGELLKTGLVLGGAGILIYHPQPELSDFVQYSVTAVLGYHALARLVVAILRRKTTIIMSRSSISVRCWIGWANYDRDLDHRFVLLQHDFAKEEQRQIEHEQREDSIKCRAKYRKPYFNESGHVALIYAGHRIDLLTVYNQADAVDIVARLQYCDARLDAAAGMGGGSKERPEDEWSNSTGGL